MRGDQTSQGLYCKENNCHETQISARKTAGLLPKPVHFTAKGPIGPLRRFRRPVMTKTTTKPIAATKEFASAPLIVLGYDQNHKPRAARFPAKDADLVTKAAQLMDLRVYAAVTEDLAALAKKLPEGRLYGNGRGFVPNVRQSLYSEIIVDARGRATGRGRQRPGRAAGRDWPTADLGRHRAWASRPRSGIPRLRVVGSHRPRSQRRHVHVAVSGLPEAAQVCSPSDAHRVDEPSG